MPFNVGKLALPWYVYAIIVVVIIIALYAFYKNLTAYTPQATAFNTTETALPSTFDAAGEAQGLESIFSETFGSEDQAAVQTLAQMTDNELIATSNAFNSAYFSNNNQTLLQTLQGLDFIFTSSTPRDELVQRMQGLGIT